MKIIKYNLCTYINHGTEEEPQIVEILSQMELKCSTKADFDANYPIAEREAVPGSIEVTGEFDPESEIDASTDEILNTLLGVTE